MEKKPILWVLGIVLVILLFIQVPKSTQLYSTWDSSNLCTVGEAKCCGTPNLFCIDGTGIIQFKCEKSTTGGTWVNHGSKSGVCTSAGQSCTTGDEKCYSQNFVNCENSLWVLKGITPGKCGVAGVGQICTPGAYRCLTNSDFTDYEVCNSQGTSWNVIKICTSTQSCSVSRGGCYTPSQDVNDIDTNTNTQTTSDKITIPIINIQVTTMEAITGGVGILFLLFFIL